jgi:type IV pilus assembly protein PilY1
MKTQFFRYSMNYVFLMLSLLGLLSVSVTVKAGTCGTANGVSTSTEPPTTGKTLCASGGGTATFDTISCPEWTWICKKNNDSSPATCKAPNSSCKIDGACGTANNSVFTAAPTTNLCSAGNPSPSSLPATPPWDWICTGLNGGTTANNCSAQLGYVVTTSVSPVGGGTIDPTSKTVASGQTTSFAVAANTDYVIGTISGCGGTPPSGHPTSFSYITGAITGSCTVTATFLPALTVTASASPSGSGSFSPTSTSVISGYTASFYNVLPNTGYSRDSNVGGTCPQGSWSGNTWTTGTITSSCTVIFNFSLTGSTTTTACAAGDIDLFVQPSTGSTNVEDLPNLLFVIDNAANFSSAAGAPSCLYPDGTTPSLGDKTGALEQCAFFTAMNALQPDKVKIGVMFYNANNLPDWEGNKNCPGGEGGCLVMPLTPMTAANKTKFLNWVKSWDTSGQNSMKANNGAMAASMQEAWAYFNGKTGISGRSYASIKPTRNSCDYIAFIGNSYGSSSHLSEQGGDPWPPLDGTGAVGTNADPAATAAQKIVIQKTITTQCGSYILPGASLHKEFYADEWSRYMQSTSCRLIKTHTIGVLAPSCSGQSDAAAIFKSTAVEGGGKYFYTTKSEELAAAIMSIFSEIQAVNSVFASVSLPASVNTQGTFLNRIYTGMFRPDPSSATPRWHGNLKQYKLGLTGNDLKLKLLDANNALAVDGNTGFMDSCARSFWTPTTDDTYWSKIDDANCTSHAATSNTPDGPVVEKGAQGYMLRSSSPGTDNTGSNNRMVYTCPPTMTGCQAGSRKNFDVGNTDITQSLLGAADATERTKLINWARGVNNNTADENDNFITSSTAMRPSVHGDVLHSRPVAINYGTDAAPDIVVFYGDNNGTLRAINGNRVTTSNIDGVTLAGDEYWSFIPPEFYRHIKRLYDNNLKVSYYGLPPGGEPKPYAIDGSVTAYQKDSTVWLFATMRRGGRAIYAFDVSDATDPVLKWKKGCGCLTNCPEPRTGVDDESCTTGLDDIGQTWSSAIDLKASGYGSGNDPMVIFGGGYDVCEDVDTNTPCASGAKGDHVYVLDADDGTWLKTFNTNRGVAADITVVKDTATGLAKYAYVADLGGNVYRIDIGADAPDDWTMTKIASLGCGSGGTNCNRKFMFRPDVVYEDGIYYILIGSGDREKPLRNYTNAFNVKNYFFMLMDKPSDPSWFSTPATVDSLLLINTTSDPVFADVEAHKGWALALKEGEQVVTSAFTVYGNVSFSTHEPAAPASATACPCGKSPNLGTARAYNIRYRNAAASPDHDDRYAEVQGGGLSPSPVGGLVKLDEGNLIVPFCIGCDPNSALEAGEIPMPPAAPGYPYRARSYWYIAE